MIQFRYFVKFKYLKWSILRVILKKASDGQDFY